MAENEAERIGFAGLGLMGMPIAQHLLELRTPLAVWNRSPEKAQSLAEAQPGAVAVSTPSQLGSCKVVVAMMLDGSACDIVLNGPDGLLSGASTPDVFVNMATISRREAVGFKTACEARDCAYLSAPVSGSTQFARNGELTVILSGDEEAADSVLPLLETIGKKVIRVGDGVEAVLLKLAVNMVIGVYTSGVYEAIAMCLKGRIPESRYLEVLNDSVVGTAYSRYKAPGLIAHDYAPGHSLEGLRKDFRLIDATASELGAPIPLTALVRQQISAAVGRGEGDLDMTAMVRQSMRDAGILDSED